jgi:hypothetical protein
MFRKALALACLAAVFAAHAQEPALTASGRKVVLNPDGTWKYAEGDGTTQPSKSVSRRPVGAETFGLPRMAPLTFGFDPKKWVRQPQGSIANQIHFVHRSGEAYGLVIFERITLNASAMKQMAIGNAQKLDPNVRVLSEESRTANGLQGFGMRMRAQAQGLSLDYTAYYYTGDEGIVQVIGFAGEKLFPEYAQDLEEFLAGLSR